MNKQLFELDIENKIHEELYIKDDSKIQYNIGCYGCLKKENSYTIYHITEEEICIVLGVFNNESDAYEYLKEIMDYIHSIKINTILDNYFNEHTNREIVQTYMYMDDKLEEEFQKRLENKVKTKKKGKNKYYERNSREIN